MKNYFSNFLFFRSFIGNRLILLFIITFLVGMLDGIGLTLFIPLIQLSQGGEANGMHESLGNLKVLIDAINGSGIQLSLNNILLIIVLVFGAKGLANYLASFLFIKLRLRFISGLRKRMMSLLARLKYDFYTKSDPGRIQNSISDETNRVSDSFKNYVSTAQSFIMLLIYMLLAFLSNPSFAALVVVGGLAINQLYRVLYKITKKRSRDFSDSGHKLQGQLIQTLTHYKYLKATSLVQKFQSITEKRIDQIEKIRLDIGKIDAFLISTRETTTIILVVLLMWIQINLFDASVNSLMLSLLFFYRALSKLIAVQNTYNSFLVKAGAIANTQDFLKELSANQATNGTLIMDAPSTSITVEGLQFSYEPGQYVLSAIDLQIQEKETIALVGESGSGKTTFANLIAGLFEQYEGSIKINGIEIKDLDRSVWQKNIGYITQEPVIFNTSVFDNVSFFEASTPENRKRVEAALEKASILDFVQSLPQGLESPLGHNGINISGGQKQRISIARELYKEPRLFILDEATSALYTKTEKIIQENIDQLKGHYTIIVIAHRLSTIQNADRIVLLEKGKIKSIGNFKELISHSASFRTFFELTQNTP